MRSFSHSIVIASLCLASLLVSGCGLQGPLYLPHEKQAPSSQPVPAATTTSPTTNDANDDSSKEDRSKKESAAETPAP